VEWNLRPQLDWILGHGRMRDTISRGMQGICCRLLTCNGFRNIRTEDVRSQAQMHGTASPPGLARLLELRCRDPHHEATGLVDGGGAGERERGRTRAVDVVCTASMHVGCPTIKNSPREAVVCTKVKYI
jgi:hypothetical protein